MYPKEMYPKEILSPANREGGLRRKFQVSVEKNAKKEPNRPVRLKHAGFGFERFRADRVGQTPGGGVRSYANPWPPAIRLRQ